MAKNNKFELKAKEGGDNVLEKSKLIKKKTKKKLVKNSIALKKETGTSNGSVKAGDEKDQSTRGKKKEKNSNCNKVLEKIEKKKAKKLAKKLKIQKKKGANVFNSGSEKTESVKKIGDLSKQKKKMHQGDGLEKQEPRERDPAKEAATVFVGNLPVNTKRVQLVRLFNDYGPVNAIRFRTASGKVLFKHKQRKEAGTLNAWVVLKDAETAASALALNGTVFKNNHLRITRADLKSTSIDGKRTVFVGNLKYSANEEKLREIFSTCGDIDYVRCLHDDKGCKGVAYVCFKAPEAVGLALELNETVLDERPIHVERYSVRKLGAKMGQDTKTSETKQSSGNSKKGKGKKLKDEGKKTHSKDSDLKKNKFRGVKVDAIKKKQKNKSTNQLQKLAKKIAPKERP